MNSCKFSVAVLREQGFQDKHHVRSVIIFVCGKVKTITVKTLSETSEDMLDKVRYLDKAKALIP